MELGMLAQGCRFRTFKTHTTHLSAPSFWLAARPHVNRSRETWHCKHACVWMKVEMHSCLARVCLCMRTYVQAYIIHTCVHAVSSILTDEGRPVPAKSSFCSRNTSIMMVIRTHMMCVYVYICKAHSKPIGQSS